MTTAVFLRRLSVACVVGYAALATWIVFANPAQRVEVRGAGIYLALGLIFLFTPMPHVWPSWSFDVSQRQLGLLFLIPVSNILLGTFTSEAFGNDRIVDGFASDLNQFFSIMAVAFGFTVAGSVRWPRLQTSASRQAVVVYWCVAVLPLALICVWLLLFPEQGYRFDYGKVAILTALTVASAAFEEITCRVLILTGLICITRSAVMALILSSTFFGLLHVPGEFTWAVIHDNWSILARTLHEYPPGFLQQSAMGVVFGALWLRTGSLLLITTVHSLVNIWVSVA